MPTIRQLVPIAALLAAAACGTSNGAAPRDASPVQGDTTMHTPSPSADGTITVTGTIRRSGLEGGFFAIQGDDGTTYDPRDLPADFRQDGLRVRAKLKLRNDMMGTHQVGPIVDVLEIQRNP